MNFKFMMPATCIEKVYRTYDLNEIMFGVNAFSDTDIKFNCEVPSFNGLLFGLINLSIVNNTADNGITYEVNSESNRVMKFMDNVDANKFYELMDHLKSIVYAEGDNRAQIALYDPANYDIKISDFNYFDICGVAYQFVIFIVDQVIKSAIEEMKETNIEEIIACNDYTSIKVTKSAKMNMFYIRIETYGDKVKEV